MQAPARSMNQNQPIRESPTNSIGQEIALSRIEEERGGA